MTRPLKISVCIPAYNRSNVLAELLESILKQDYLNYEIVINEDKSPERALIRDIVERYSKTHPNLIKYFENDVNFGYDKNLRSLIERSTGDYCLFMGNDDLMADGALSEISRCLTDYPKIGVFLRSFAAFEGDKNNIVQQFRYFDKERFFPAGKETITTFFKRCVVIPGVTIQRSAALQFSTDKFDGTLLYQIYLIANILVEWNGVFSPKVVTLYRNGGIPDFGNSESEKGKFVPQTRTIESSVNFMRGMLNIAKDTEISRGINIFAPILKDLSNYSYPILSVQANRSIKEFTHYYVELIRLGFGKQVLFHLYFILILALGAQRMDHLIGYIKRKLGYTPALGRVFSGNQKK